MNETLWNLTWALPVVLLTGLIAALVLRRAMSPSEPAIPARGRARLCETLEVSSDTRLYVVEVDRKSYLLVESVMQTSLHATAASTAVAMPTPNRVGAPWLVRLCRGEPR
jgi:flagellar biogenesis protein FliO